MCFGPGQVADVEVAVARRAGKGRCRFLQADGEFADPQSCEQKTFLPAEGAKRWHFRSPWHGTPGRYVVYSQAVDAVGNIETKQSGRNRARFRIR